MMVTLAAAAVLMVTMGTRQSMGLFISPITASTGLSIAALSLALAVGQFVWDAIQPIAGAVADRYGPGKVLVAGIVILALAFAITPFMTSSFGLIVSMGILMAIGSGAGSFSVLLGAAAQKLAPEQRGMSAGIIVGLCGLPPTVASWSLAIIGLSNIAGSLLAGNLTAKMRSKYILAAMYGSRALLIGCYLLSPKTAITFYIFAVGLGFTWLATVPPTATIVGKLFGVRYLATLFGLTLLSHQIGGFLGAYLGGLAYEGTGSYQWMWYADMALAAMAAVVNLPIREKPIEPAPVPA